MHILRTSCTALGALALLGTASCSKTETTPPPTGDGAYRYVLGVDPVTGESIVGGVHKVVTITADRGKAEAIDSPNMPSRLHPDLGGTEYGTFDGALTTGETSWDVFASNWWPQSKNGTAWRWQPGANQDYNDISDTDTLSPLEKYDLLAYPGQPQDVAEVEHCEYRDFVDNGEEDCAKILRPAVTVAGPSTKWELENQGQYQTYDPENWWGHCNGWASYATAEPLGFPQRDVRVKLDGTKVTECAADETAEDGCILFKMADVEALMTELYFSDQATFSGRRCNLAPDEIEKDEFGRPLDVECRDLNPASLHVAMVGLLNKGARHLVTGEDGAKPAFVIDHNYDFEVWNFPLVKYELRDTVEITKEEAQALVAKTDDSDDTDDDAATDYQFNPAATKFVQVNATYWMVSDGVPPNQLQLRADQRSIPLHDVDLSYVLELDDSDRILGGEWIEEPGTVWGSNSKELHPDFMWMATNPVGWGESADDRGGNSDNPYVSYPVVQSILRCANEPESCGGTPIDPPDSLCENECGNGPFSENGASCYCDDACLTYNDCCSGYADACSAPAGVCGDGVVDSGDGEECDDGNNADGDGCSATCTTEVAPGVCGDGTVDSGEECDDGNNTDGDGCSATCTTEVAPGVCGDGTVDSGEECDDGNNADGDGCSAACTTEAAPASCAGSCGSSDPAPGSNPACYCDQLCEGYGDCCEDFGDVCSL